jgi:hypothetical protein
MADLDSLRTQSASGGCTYNTQTNICTWRAVNFVLANAKAAKNTMLLYCSKLPLAHVGYGWTSRDYSITKLRQEDKAEAHNTVSPTFSELSRISVSGEGGEERGTIGKLQ